MHRESLYDTLDLYRIAVGDDDAIHRLNVLCGNATAALSRSVGRARLARHEEFVSQRRDDGSTLEYEAEHYETPVMTKMERRIQFREATAVDSLEEDRDGERGYRVSHRPLSLE